MVPRNAATQGLPCFIDAHSTRQVSNRHGCVRASTVDLKINLIAGGFKPFIDPCVRSSLAPRLPLDFGSLVVLAAWTPGNQSVVLSSNLSCVSTFNFFLLIQVLSFLVQLTSLNYTNLYTSL